MKFAARLMLAAGAASLLVAPIAAQANTRAGDSGAVYSVSSAAPGIGRADEGEGLAGGLGIFLLLGALGVTITGLVATDAFSSDNGDNQSPGT